MVEKQTQKSKAEMTPAQEQNERNARCSAGCSDGENSSELLTPAQVRAMDRREVRDNYALILESMKHWQ